MAVQRVSRAEAKADFFLITLAWLLKELYWPHPHFELDESSGTSPTLFLFWVVFSALVSGLVWPLGEYGGISLCFRNSEGANIASIVRIPWGFKTEDSNIRLRIIGANKERGAHSQALMKIPYRMEWACQIFLLGSAKSQSLAASNINGRETSALVSTERLSSSHVIYPLRHTAKIMAVV